jgi:hypothetical protein
MQIREVLDSYKQAAEQGRITRQAGDSGYPASLELLTQGLEDRKSPAGRADGGNRRSMQQYPRALEDLLADNRFVVPMRHLRKIYRDPISLTQEWGIVRGPDGGISGVYSPSTAEPMKKGNFTEANSDFAGKTAYYDWFVYGTPLPCYLWRSEERVFPVSREFAARARFACDCVLRHTVKSYYLGT